MPISTTVVNAPTKLWNSPLKNGSSSNLAVNGSSTPVVFSLAASANNDFEIHSMCLITEFSGSLAVGNKFIIDTLATLTNGLLLEAKVEDDAYSFGNMKRTRDLVELSQPQGGFNLIAGTTSLFQAFFYVPPRMKLCKLGTYEVDDYVKATVRDDLRNITYCEIFLQGVKL